ncbi:IS4 family transposase, partial [Phytopseudomonas daroniae]|uniref:IS4 family transposase n=1 Tax=Pseudomonadaceae TaxID=135621 RepID=UPI0010375C1E
PLWIEEALRLTGTVSLRRRRLPAERIVWLVVGMALFKNEPIWLIVQQLGLSDGQGLAPVPSAAVQARQRLGEAPLEALFEQLAQAWLATEPPACARFHGLRSFAVDGVVWSMPDTPENREAFSSGKNQHGVSNWPQARGVCLMDTYSHLIRAARFGSFAVGELSFARELAQAVGDHSLTIFDRAYYSATFLLDWQRQGAERHWLMRAKSTLRHDIVKTFGPGDWLVRLPVSPQARRQQPQLPEYWQARLIERRVDGKPRRYLSSLCDPHRYPADQVAAHYRERWEIELGYREIKQGLQDGGLLRSKLPELARQELWGTLLAYNLIRQEMHLMAEELEIPPQRLSFQWLAIAIAGALRYCPTQTPATIPQRLAELRIQARHFVLPPRRERHYPRVVKPKPTKYPKKKNASQLN